MRDGLIQIIETREHLERDDQGVVKLNITGKEQLYVITAEQYGTRNGYTYGWFSNQEMLWTTTLRELTTVRMPSKEEIAAEESVAKAKEALKAAENALKVVKEQTK